MDGLNGISLGEALKPTAGNIQAQLVVMDIANQVQKATTADLLDNTIKRMSPTGRLFDGYA